MYQSNWSFHIRPPPPPGIPRAIDAFSCPGGREFITTHRGWGIWSLASMSCYEINFRGDVKLWSIQKKRLPICGGLVENQRPTQAVFRIWRCLRTIYIFNTHVEMCCLIFQQLFGPVRGEFEQKFFKNSNARGVAQGGGMLKLQFDW